MTKKSKLLDQLPDALDVGWTSFKFIVKANLLRGSQKCYGITDFNLNTITIEKSLSDDVAHATIIHEVCHAFMETFGLGGDHEGEEDKLTTSNEYLTEATCRSFLMFKNLNPKLWDILFVDYYKEKTK